MDAENGIYGTGAAVVVMHDHDDPEEILAGKTVMADLVDENGERVPVTVEEFADYIEDHGLAAEVIEPAYLGGGIFRLMFHPERIENADYGEIKHDTPIRAFVGGTVFMRMDIPYFAIREGDGGMQTARLLACDPEAVKGAEAEAATVYYGDDGVAVTNGSFTICEDVEGGGTVEHDPAEFGLDFSALYMFRGGGDKYLTFTDAAFSLLTIQTGLGLAIEHERRLMERAEGVSISTSAISKVRFATDKVNRKVWKQWATLEPGQLALGFAEDGSADLDIDMANKADRGRGITRPLIYAIDFTGLEELGIAPKLEPYDRRVYEALSSLWNYVTTETGQDVFSLKDIYYAMGYTGNPNARDKKRIGDSLTKMLRATVKIDNLEESSAYTRYPRFVYEASLLPSERITGYVDGQITGGLVHLFREPPLFTFARERGQFTTHKVNVLQSPLSKTSTNLLIEDYLREQIAWMKKKGSTRSNKITLEEIYEEAGIKRADARTRKRADVVKLLKHYKECGWIVDYRDVGDGFEIIY